MLKCTALWPLFKHLEPKSIHFRLQAENVNKIIFLQVRKFQAYSLSVSLTPGYKGFEALNESPKALNGRL